MSLRARHQHFLQPSHTIKAFAGWCDDGYYGCGGFWLLCGSVNVNYLVIQDNLPGIKSLQAVNDMEPLGSTTYPPKNQLSCLQPRLR